MDIDMTRRPDVSSVVDLALQIDSDERMTEGQLRRRDRAIGRELEALRGHPRRQILAWLSKVSGGKRSPLGASLSRALRIGTLLLGLTGLFFGGITAAAVFYYSGRQPVNIIHVLAVFVVLQMILVLVLILTLLPRSLLRWIPGASTVLETAGMLSPGRLRKIVSRHLPEEYRHRAAAVLGKSRAHRLLFGKMEKWLVVSSSQLFAVAFNCGALMTCLYLVSFTDLAFAWSTTLQVTAADIHFLTTTLATPWRDLVPDADPSLALIEGSRYYRLKGGLLPGTGAQAGAGPAFLGGWWPFLAMAMLFYGLLPRVALWVFSLRRLQSAVNGTLMHLPGVANLLDRMNREIIETQAREAEITEGRLQSGTAAAPKQRLDGTPCTILSWSDVLRDGETLSRDAARTWGCAPTEVLAAGGANTLAEDAEIIARAAGRSAGGGIIIFVRSWEPPLQDFLDFLSDLRTALPAAAPIVVAPLSAGARPCGEAHLAVWRQSLQRLGDPWLSVEPVREEAS